MAKTIVRAMAPPLLLILGLALLVRALCFILAATHPERFFTIDSVGYMALAEDLHAGYLDPRSNTFVTGLIRTPAYPAFLGALLGIFRGSVPTVIAVQIGVALVTVWLAWVLATRLLGPRSALLGVWQRLLAITPPARSVIELGSRQRALALQVLAEHPLGAVKMIFHGLARMMAGTGLTALSNLLGDPDPQGVFKPWKRAVQALQLLALGIVPARLGQSQRGPAVEPKKVGVRVVSRNVVRKGLHLKEPFEGGPPVPDLRTEIDNRVSWFHSTTHGPAT